MGLARGATTDVVLRRDLGTQPWRALAPRLRDFAMTTEDLIRALTADRHLGRNPKTSLLLAALFMTAFVATVFFAAIGVRHDFDAALGTVRFLFKFVVVGPLAVAAIAVLSRSASPVRTLGWWGRLLAVPLALIAAGAVAELIVIPRSGWMVRLIGSNAVNCMTLIPLLAMAPLAVFIGVLRHGAPAHAGLSGALAGLAASSIAAIFYATNCFDDSPLFVITWYPLAIGSVMCLGYVAGRRYLQW